MENSFFCFHKFLISLIFQVSYFIHKIDDKTFFSLIFFELYNIFTQKIIILKWKKTINNHKDKKLNFDVSKIASNIVFYFIKFFK